MLAGAVEEETYGRAFGSDQFLDRMIEEHGHYLFVGFALVCFLFLVWISPVGPRIRCMMSPW